MANRSVKRFKTTHYRDRIPLEDDIEVVHARSSGLTSWNAPNISSRSPLRGRTTWKIGKAWAPDDDEELALDDSGAWFDEEIQADVFDSQISRVEEPLAKKKRMRSQASIRPHVVWKNHYRDTFLDEAIRAEGRGDFAREAECPDCLARRREVVGKPEYRCIDCFLPDLSCKECCLKRHQRLPFHTIEKWTGATFVKVSLKSLGLTVHLNHSSLRCPIPIACHQDFRIIHTNGIHDVAFSYCGCHRSIPHHLQLLRRSIYPASQITPRTGVTFELLRLLHLLSLTSKASTYDFYRALERLSDNTGTNVPKSRYRPLLRVGLQWRHLKMLKRAGRGHDETGVAGTKDGELAVQCPSCPHPGINLPMDWREVPESRKFLYRLLICMDANFRLKNQLVSNYSQDPGLGTGWAYMVRTKPYEDYVLSKASEDDISTCVAFLAMSLALTRFSQGLRYTGVGGTFCGRGEMFMPNGVGNLQKGERYANMDYILGSAIRGTELQTIGISYDICCQWYTNLRQRIEKWPESIKLPTHIKTIPLIPKFHEPAHNDRNHEQYSFNAAVGVGNSDGEVPERAWAGHNGLGNATKTQGPGSRHDVLDDHFGFWNWRKYCNMGNTLIRRYKLALMERNKQVEAHRGFTASLPDNLVSAWEVMCANWDADEVPKSQPNPYAVEGSGLSQAKVNEELRKEESRGGGSGSKIAHSTSPADFIRMGLELEEAQHKLRSLVKEQIGTPKALQGASLKEQRARLAKAIKNWELLRATYMPGLLQYHLESEAGAGGPTPWDDDPNPEDVNLFLPSQVLEDCRRTVCTEGLSEIELKYRDAQCHDALEALRHTLRIKTRMILFKNKNIRGQVQSTRSRALIDRVHRRALASVDKYRHARAAKMALCGPGAWEEIFRPLLNSDVRGYSDPRRNPRGPGRRGIWEDGQQPQDVAEEAEGGEGDTAGIERLPHERSRREGTGRTTHEISWIWMGVGGNRDVDGKEGDEIVRAEWARSRARVQRCKEEVQLLIEEMRRTLAYLDWKEQWWLDRRRSRAGVSPELQEGIFSYAEGQAAIHASLSATFIMTWRTPLGLVDECALVEDDEAEASNTAERDGLDSDEEDENMDDAPEEGGAGNQTTCDDNDVFS